MCHLIVHVKNLAVRGRWLPSSFLNGYASWPVTRKARGGESGSIRCCLWLQSIRGHSRVDSITPSVCRGNRLVMQKKVHRSNEMSNKDRINLYDRFIVWNCTKVGLLSSYNCQQRYTNVWPFILTNEIPLTLTSHYNEIPLTLTSHYNVL